MPKIQYPPQGGEKRLCLTLFFTMMLSVMSAVAIIYSIVIIYLPSLKELQSDLEGPKMCTTLSKEGNLSGPSICTWSSCEEWCLSMSSKSCHHMYAAVRELGTQIWWDGCDFSENYFFDYTCNTLEDLEPMNCKQYPYEKDSDGKPGNKDTCITFDNVIISCESGVCKNVSEVYSCTYQAHLTDIEEANQGKGACNCQNCDKTNLMVTQIDPLDPNKKVTPPKYPGECPADTASCWDTPLDKWNKTRQEACRDVWCYNCRDVCHANGKCYDLLTRKDPTILGTDQYGLSDLTYYECKKAYCSEIYELKCQRRCDGVVFNAKQKNSILFIGERIIMAQCARRSTVNISTLDNGDSRRNTLMVACTNVTIDKDAGTMISQDCVNGTWLRGTFENDRTNYSQLTTVYSGMREQERNRAQGIDYELDITIYNRTKMKINIGGCVNNLNMDCMRFYHNFGKDGRNYTARAVYPCYYDPYDSDFVVTNFDPDMTLLYLILFLTIPCGIMIISCLYMCGCSRFIHVSDDGHMRLRCCGNYVTGIGNVPKWDPPQRKKQFADT